MRYALVRDGAIAQYPYSFSMLRRDNPMVSFPRDPDAAKLAEWGVVTVHDAPQPAYDVAKDIVESTPVLSGGTWVQSWQQVDADPEVVAQRLEGQKTKTERSEIVADKFVGQFIAMTPAQVAAYVDGNVTDLASAKTLLKRMAVMMLLMARREFR